MSKIRNSHDDNRKVVTFSHDVREPTELPGMTGVISEISWNNPKLMEGLRTMFGCPPHEQIVAVEITDAGIRAKFKIVK